MLMKTMIKSEQSTEKSLDWSYFYSSCFFFFQMAQHNTENAVRNNQKFSDLKYFHKTSKSNLNFRKTN